MLDFYIGMVCLSFLGVIVGEITISLALRFNQSHLDQLNHDITHRETLSRQAYYSGDRYSFKALNKAANDAWGKHFFTMAAYSAGMLWPVPFMMAWMNTRFKDIDFILPLPMSWIFGETIRYPFLLILTYILCRILFKNMRPWLPYFRGVQRMLDRHKVPSHAE